MEVGHDGGELVAQVLGGRVGEDARHELGGKDRSWPVGIPQAGREPFLPGRFREGASPAGIRVGEYQRPHAFGVQTIEPLCQDPAP